MRVVRRVPLALRLLTALTLMALWSLVAAPAASAHAELLQASPRADSTVGGEFHSIQLQFSGLDEAAAQRFDLLDPAGTPIETQVVREGQRIILAIEPLTVPGVYTVSYTVNGADGDISSEAFVFRYDPPADHPEALTISIGGDDGFDWVALGLLLVGAGLLGYLAHRFNVAWRDHRRSAHEAPVETS